MGKLHLGLVSLLAVACATSSPPPGAGQGEGEDTEVELMSLVVEKCGIPELKTFFHFGTAQIRSGHQNLDKLAECLVRGPLRTERLLLIGRTDPTGTEAFNRKLGLWRARSVGEYLIGKGVEAKRIEYRSAGKEGASPQPENYPNDRRVDIELLL